MLSAAGIRPKTGRDVRYRALSLLSAPKGQNWWPKLFPPPSAYKGAKRAGSSSTFPVSV